MLAYSIGEFWRDLQIAIGVLAVFFLIWFFASRFRRRLALTALRSLETNFMRSLLATLGVLIGVGSVVACMAILEGATNEIIDNFKSLGSNVLYVMPSQARVQGRTVGQSQTLTTDDIPILMRELGDDIEMISPEAMGVAEVKRFKKTEPNTWVIATTPDYFLINAYEANSGRVFTKSEAGDEGSRIVCDTHLPDIGLCLVDPRTGAHRAICRPGASNQGTQWHEPVPLPATEDAPGWATMTERATGETAYGPQWSHPHPSFSPDGRRIAYTSDATGWPQVYVVDIED